MNQPILSGVSVDLSGLAPNVSAAIETFLPYFLIAAGIAVASIVLSRGLGFLRMAGGRR